jgi:endonuclease YncB( thermonuclease family)
VTVFPGLKGIVLDWHDGDTAHVDVELPFWRDLRAYSVFGAPLWSCRIQGINLATGKIQPINAPELSAPDGSGKAALAFAQQLCAPGTPVTATSTQADKYSNRWDGQLFLPTGTDFGSAMVVAGHAVWATY